MKPRTLFLILGLCLVCSGLVWASNAGMEARPWSMNATIIEACSCPMFCQCYFDHKPAEHAAHADHKGHAGGGGHFCRFNNAFQINKGSYGLTKLDGARFWIGGDLGDEFADGEMDWAVLHFDPSVTPEQREGIKSIVGYIYPVKWKSFKVGADGPMEWTHTADRAVARLDGGRTAEIVLRRNQGMTDKPIVIQNLRYWGVPRNTGFVLMQNEVEAYRAGDSSFEYKGTNGFMITFDINSKDFAGKPKG